ncbi:hypothetical protein NMG60_11014544 [Bertholletia excelsa]
MEHQEVISSEILHPAQVEMIQATEEDKILPQPVHLSQNQVCISKKDYDHSAADQRSKSMVKLCGLLAFYAIFMSIEVACGMKANSLSILTDAAHLLSDIAGISISVCAIWASSWAPTPRQPFGFNRLEVLGAFASIQLIWLICGILVYEAVNRILHKHTRVDGKLMFITAAIGFVINFIMFMWIGHDHGHGHGHGHHACLEKGELCSRIEDEGTNLVPRPPERTTKSKLNINLQGAYLHLIADIIQSAGVMIAGSIIWAKPDWLIVDVVCTLAFSLLALCTTLPMLREIICILMEWTQGNLI